MTLKIIKPTKKDLIMAEKIKIREESKSRCLDFTRARFNQRWYFIFLIFCGASIKIDNPLLIKTWENDYEYDPVYRIGKKVFRIK